MMTALTFQKQGILCESIKQYPVLFVKQLKGYREKKLIPIHEMQWQKKYESGGFYYSHVKIIRRGG